MGTQNSYILILRCIKVLSAYSLRVFVENFVVFSFYATNFDPFVSFISVAYLSDTECSFATLLFDIKYNILREFSLATSGSF